MNISTKDRIKRIYETLPKINCGRCGFDSCARFARAVSEGKASPFGCRQEPWTGYLINEIVGANIPAESTSAHRAGLSSSHETLTHDIQTLSDKVNDILYRIEKLKARIS
jgi:Na+-translocating ferredoxin:NAD+ oxidoreductase RNF subunit RnfB